MKRLSKIFTLLLVAFLITGCVKESIHMNITKSGKVELTIIEAYNSSAASYGASVSDSDKEEYKKLGYKVEDYAEEDLTGVKLTKTLNIKDVSSKDAKKVSLEDLLTKEKVILFQETGKNTYKADFVFDTSSGYDSSMEGYASSFDISYSVTLPSAPKSHNADKVEGNTLTWNVTYGEAKAINYEFSINGSFVLWIIIAIVAVAVVAIVIVVVVMSNKNKQNPMGTVSMVGNMVPPAQPVPPMGYPTTPVDNSVVPMDSAVAQVPNQPVDVPAEQSNVGEQN